MDITTLGVLGGMMTVVLAVMIYLDRSRRADLKRIDERLDRLTDVVIDLVKTVGELKGRIDALTPVEVLSATE